MIEKRIKIKELEVIVADVIQQVQDSVILILFAGNDILT